MKTTESGGLRGFDAESQINGRKRHIVVDTLGLMVGLVIHSAGIQDRDGAPDVLKTILKRWPWLRHIFCWRWIPQGQSSKAGWKRSGSSHWKSSSGPITLRVSKSFHADGLLSAHLHGWVDAVDWPKTLRKPSHQLKRGFTLQAFSSSPEAPQVHGIITIIMCLYELCPFAESENGAW